VGSERMRPSADEMATKLAVVFYSDAKDALLKSVAD
jgi:hypothetical protein